MFFYFVVNVLAIALSVLDECFNWVKASCLLFTCTVVKLEQSIADRNPEAVNTT